MVRQIDEQQIIVFAPNSAAAANGKKISQKGGFVRLERSADDSFYLGECSGSGKSNYITSIDFIDPSQPVFRCSCPSRQFPCKHSLGMLYEIMAQKNFSVCEIPEDILQKRTKKQARAEKAESASVEGTKKKTELSETSKSARTKKIKKQLEGLELTAQLVCDLLTSGLGAMGGTSLASYRQLSKRLGDYYLPGPQRYLNKLILEISAFQNDGSDVHYDNAIDVLKRLQALVKKSQQYLGTKLGSGDVGQDDNFLYEELGGVWKLSELEQLGLVKYNAKLVQLAFWVVFDESSNEYIDIACWIDIDTGEINLTKNYRPVKALKYVKQDDSFFGIAEVPKACYYPGDGNRRIRWEGMVSSSLTKDVVEKIRNFAAHSVLETAKGAKNMLKNVLSVPYSCQLVRFANIGTISDGLALEDGEGGSIMLGNMPDFEPTTMRLSILPNTVFLHDQVMLGVFYYDNIAKRMKMQPLSILTPEHIIRLLY